MASTILSFICMSFAWSELGSIFIQSGTLFPFCPDFPFNSTTSSSLLLLPLLLLLLLLLFFFPADAPAVVEEAFPPFFLGASKNPLLMPFEAGGFFGFGFTSYAEFEPFTPSFDSSLETSSSGGGSSSSSSELEEDILSPAPSSLSGNAQALPLQLD